jgi:hypothetical protein
MAGSSAAGPQGKGPLCEGYPDTPEGSEVDELEYANSMAEQLIFLSRIDRIKEHQYQRCAAWLDTIPGAGEYFRCLSMKELSDEQWEVWMWRAAWYKELIAQREQSWAIGWQARQWIKKGKNDTRRVKNQWR